MPSTIQTQPTIDSSSSVHYSSRYHTSSHVSWLYSWHSSWSSIYSLLPQIRRQLKIWTRKENHTAVPTTWEQLIISFRSLVLINGYGLSPYSVEVVNLWVMAFIGPAIWRQWILDLTKHSITKMLLLITPRIMAATNKMWAMPNKYRHLLRVTNSSNSRGRMTQAGLQLRDKIHLSILTIS